MSNEVKVPWRKNLDKRYISGEDLLNGEAWGKLSADEKKLPTVFTERN
jgi:hypothetical protein